MCQWSPRFISAAAEAGVPVQGHAGLAPRTSTWTGGLRAVGKTIEEAIWIYRDIKRLEQAGAWAVEVEVIPAALLAELTKRTTSPHPSVPAVAAISRFCSPKIFLATTNHFIRGIQSSIATFTSCKRPFRRNGSPGSRTSFSLISAFVDHAEKNDT